MRSRWGKNKSFQANPMILSSGMGYNPRICRVQKIYSYKIQICIFFVWLYQTPCMNSCYTAAVFYCRYSLQFTWKTAAARTSVHIGNMANILTVCCRLIITAWVNLTTPDSRKLTTFSAIKCSSLQRLLTHRG